MIRRGTRDVGGWWRRGWPGEWLLLQKLLETYHATPPLCTERQKSLSAATSDSCRRKKVDLKTKLQIRFKGLYLPPPLLCRRTSELKGRLLFVKQIANNWRASSV